jgi:tellurium resistance protein TerD
MAVPMARGANVTLTREIPDLRRVVLGISWNAGAEVALADNVVSATLLCDAKAKALSAEHFVFFNQLASPDLSVQRLERALGDDQDQIEIDLPSVPAEVERIAVIVYINDGLAARRTLGQLKSCAIRVLNGVNNTELIRSENLAPGLRNETALSLGELYRHSGDWKFRVLGQGYSQGLPAVLTDYGLAL